MVFTCFTDSFYPPRSDYLEQINLLGSGRKIPALTYFRLDRKATRYRADELETVRGLAFDIKYRAVRFGFHRCISAARDAVQLSAPESAVSDDVFEHCSLL